LQLPVLRLCLFSVCHSAAQRRNLLLHLPLPVLRFAGGSRGLQPRTFFLSPTLKNPSKSACQAPRRPEIPITPTPSTTSLRKIAGILVMLRLIQLIYGSNPSRGSLYRAEINSRRPLAPFFLNRISRTESISCQQPPHGTSFWRSPRSRHSGAAPGVVILARSQESSFWRSQNLRIGFYCAAALQEDRISRTESIFYPQIAANQSFAASTRSKASFSPITLIP
jgi:hypothetical protein